MWWPVRPAGGAATDRVAVDGDLNVGADFWPSAVLRDYALLADGERGILVGPDGAMVWLCFPRWDSPAVLAALIGGGGGYQVRPADQRCVWGGYYDDGGLIWCNR